MSIRLSASAFVLFFFTCISSGWSAQNNNPLPNYDARIRQDRNASRRNLNIQSAPFGQMQKAEEQLTKLVPRLKIKYHPILGGPSVVGVQGGHRYLTEHSNEDREQILRRFLSDHSALYGLTDDQIYQMKTIANYTNPAGNLSFVRLQQTIQGIPVFRGNLRAAFTQKGELIRITSEFVPFVDPNSLVSPARIKQNEAIAIAAKSIGIEITGVDSDLRQVYFPLSEGVVVLGWSLIARKDLNRYYMVVDAQTGEILFRKNLVNDQQPNIGHPTFGQVLHPPSLPLFRPTPIPIAFS